MEEIKINTGTSESRTLLDEPIANFSKHIPSGKKVIIITDANLRKHYENLFQPYAIIEVGLGEENKTMSTIETIMGRLVELEADRSSFIVGIGGGIVCDITGFVASVYMRGLRFGFVSTSLLSQVDASVGGKNGVNYKGFKNMVGVFNQPEFVICDLDVLKTLPRDEFIGGFAEIIKHGAIKDRNLFTFIEENCNKALAFDKEVLHRMVHDSVVIKGKVVEADEHEKGERRKLNFGHTFGHALEKLTGISHGKAIGIGMMMAAEASVKLGFLDAEDAKRLEKVIAGYQLPVQLKIDKTMLLQAMRKDKKREGEGVHLVLLKGLGTAFIHTVSYKQLEEIIYDMHCCQ